MSKRVKFLLIFASLSALFLPVINTEAQPIKVAIAYSDSLNSTIRTLKGIKNTLDNHHDDIQYREYLIAEEQVRIDEQINEIRLIDPAIILTIGTIATKSISDRITDKPIVFSAVLNPETSGFVKSLREPGGNITGASLDIPPDIQFKYFKNVIRELKKIGVLYTEETANLIPPARILAAKAGLELHAARVNSEKEIPAKLDSIISLVDGLWSVADANIFSPSSTKFILLHTLRSSKPVMGFSENLVEAGALFGLCYDYKDIGRQAGKIALEVLSGKPPAHIPVAVPGIIWFQYNDKTARHINVEIPAELIAVAKEVYQ